MTEPPRICVTGATGFLGSEIVRRGLEARLQIVPVARREFSDGATFRCADVLDFAALCGAFDGTDTVIHAAGLAHVFRGAEATKDRFKAVNEVGTENVVKAAATTGVKHVVLVSSVAVYGRSEYPYDETLACQPKGPYAISKWRSEQRAAEVAEVAGVGLTILRLTTLYGAGDPGNVARLIRMIDSGRFMWIGDGSNRKTLLHCTDAAAACLLAANVAPKETLRFNVADCSHTMAEVVDLVSRFLNRTAPRLKLPREMAVFAQRAASRLPGPSRQFSDMLNKWLHDDVFDGARFGRTFGFAPSISLEEGIREEVQYYLENHAAS